MSEPYVGEIRMFGGNFAPRGWAFCNGQLLSIQTNQALFSILGTTYGGNGQSTFGLPNFQGSVPIHWGTGPGLTPRVLGEKAGSESVSLLQAQMPMHTHLVACKSEAGSLTSPSGNFPAGNLVNRDTGVAQDTSYETAPPDGAMNPAALSQAGGSQPHENMQPFLAVSFIIALVGIFPSRN